MRLLHRSTTHRARSASRTIPLAALCLLPSCGDEPTSAADRDLADLCAGRRTELAVRFVVETATNMPFAVGDTLRATLQFAPHPDAASRATDCPVGGSMRLATTAAGLEWARDTADLSFRGSPNTELPTIEVIGSGGGPALFVLLPVRDSVGTWEHYVPARSAGASGSVRYRMRAR